VVERQTVLHQACDQIGRVPIPTRMSFRVELSTDHRQCAIRGWQAADWARLAG